MTPAEKELADLRRLADLENKMAAAAKKPSTFLEDAGNFVKSAGSDLLRGFLRANAPYADNSAGGDPLNPASLPPGMFTPQVSPQARQKALETSLPVPQGDGTARQFLRAGLEGTGGALTATPAGPVVPAIAANFAGGVGAELGGRFGADANAPVLGSVAGSVLLGGLAGLAAGPRQSIVKSDIRRQLPPIGDKAWEEAARNKKLFEEVGATSATAADLFPDGSSIQAYTRRAASTDGGEALKNKLTDRPDDLKALGNKFIDNLGPRAEPTRVANELADAANGFLKGQKKLRSDAIRNRLEGKTIAPREAKEIYDALLFVADQQAIPGVAQAYREVAKNMVSTNGEILRSVQDLSLQIKSLKDRAKNPITTQSGAPDIMAGFGRPAIADAELALGEASRPFKEAMDEFSAFTSKNTGSTQSFEALSEGPFGRLADRNPNNVTATPTSRLNLVMEGNNPTTIAGIARTLDSPVMTTNPVSPRSIASAIAQERLSAGSANPGLAIRGLAGSGKEAQMNALIQAGGLDPAMVNKPLQAADKLQAFTAGDGFTAFPDMRWYQAAFRPFRTLDMMVTAGNQRGIYREVANLMVDPNNLDKLREIAMFNPVIRQAMTANSALLPGLNQGFARNEE